MALSQHTRKTKMTNQPTIQNPFNTIDTLENLSSLLEDIYGTLSNECYQSWAHLSSRVVIDSFNMTYEDKLEYADHLLFERVKEIYKRMEEIYNFQQKIKSIFQRITEFNTRNGTKMMEQTTLQIPTELLDEIDTLLQDAANALSNECYRGWERLTENVIFDSRNMSYEEKLEYGDGVLFALMKEINEFRKQIEQFLYPEE